MKRREGFIAALRRRGPAARSRGGPRISRLAAALLAARAAALSAALSPAALLRRRRGAVAGALRARHGHARALAQPVGAVDHHDRAGLDPGLDQRALAVGRAD